MSVIENIRGKAAAAIAPVTPAQIQIKLDAAASKAAVLRDEHRRLALAAVEGQADAMARVDVIGHELAKIDYDVATLQSAKAAAEARDQLTFRKQRAELYQSQLRSLKVHLGKRDRAAEELTDALKAACLAWNNILDATLKAENTAGAIGPLPPGIALFGLEGLQQAVQHEIWRLGSDPTSQTNRLGFPAGASFDLSTRQNPKAIPPLPDTIKAASARVIATLSGKEVG